MTNIKKTKPVLESKGKNVSSSINFPVVGIGASAGGLEALEQFFKNVPASSGIAYVVVQHLDPERVDMMPELLQRITKMKVVQVSDRMEIQRDHVYVIPPNKSMSILNGFLYLFEPVESRGLRLPIDFFFRSLADDRRENSVGIILSGMGTDGSLGLKAIKEKNGIIVVQDPITAKFDGMPESAIKAVNVDIMAAANELPKKLLALLKFSTSALLQRNIDDEEKNNFEKIIILLRTQTGHDFSLYKTNTLSRRIERRMNVHQISKISDYIRYLQKNPNELDILFNELLIGVTNFFRDPEVWEKMKKTILPDLIRTLPKNYTLRAWIAGCSTGEEAYSLAIIFKEVCETINNDQNVSLQIFASDIDSNAIEKARTGFFNYNISADVSPGRIKKYFKKEGSGFRINTTIREMIVFAPHDIIKDPPFTKLDLLFCRNLLIYLELELQKKLMRLFHYSLKEDGVMLLGNAESENAPKGMFTHIDQKLKFYKRTSINTNMNLLDFPSSNTDTKKNKRSNIILNKTIDTLQVLTDQIVLQRFAPASVLINSDGDILYITGRTGKYIEPSAGRANWNIYAMAREGLKYELPSAIRKVKQNYDPIKLHNLKVETNGKSQYVDVTIQQIEKPETIKGMIIIVFSDVVELPKAISNKTKSSNKDISSPEKELAFKLQHANEELHNTREEMQIAQEELKSANEELQTINEELQSTNEELTSSKEEMQSLNEELQTVNAELQSKVNDFTVANNDLKNLLNSTDIATLFLDNDLNICRFTEQLTKLFKLRPGDIGRPFTDMVSNLDYPDMSNDAKEVLRTLVYKETPVATDDNRWFKVRIMPYRTIDDRIEGLVVTFIEMTELKSKEDQLNQAIALLRKHDLYKP